MDYEQQMMAANTIGTAMMSAMASKCNAPEAANWPDAVAIYGAVFCLVDIALQMDADLKFVLDVVSDVYKTSSSKQNLYGEYVN